MTLTEHDGYDGNAKMPAARYGEGDDRQRQNEEDIFGDDGEESIDGGGNGGSDSESIESEEEDGSVEGHHKPPWETDTMAALKDAPLEMQHAIKAMLLGTNAPVASTKRKRVHFLLVDDNEEFERSVRAAAIPAAQPRTKRGSGRNSKQGGGEE